MRNEHALLACSAILLFHLAGCAGFPANGAAKSESIVEISNSTSNGTRPIQLFGTPPKAVAPKDNNLRLILFDSEKIAGLRLAIKAGNGSEYGEWLNGLEVEASSFLAKDPPSVTGKDVYPEGADGHQYVSLAPYTWPDSSKTGHEPYVSLDGQSNPESKNQSKYDSIRISEMSDAVAMLSFAYALTGNETYAKKAADYIHVWFVDPDTRMSPDLEYAQLIPGRKDLEGYGVIDTVVLIPVADSVKMLSGSKSLSAKDRIAVKKWFGEYASWLRLSRKGLAESKGKNNHGVWYDAQLAAFLDLDGDWKGAFDVLDSALGKRAYAQIEEDGRMPEELSRTKSFQYTLYNLEAFITLARAGDLYGLDIWEAGNPQKSRLKRAIAFACPYIAGEKDWPYTEISPGAEHEFARYLAIAEARYGSGDCASAINALLTNGSGSLRLETLAARWKLQRTPPKP